MTANFSFRDKSQADRGGSSLHTQPTQAARPANEPSHLEGVGILALQEAAFFLRVRQLLLDLLPLQHFFVQLVGQVRHLGLQVCLLLLELGLGSFQLRAELGNLG